MGPHGIIMGSAGTGKTEMLRTIILSMASSFSPQEVNFVVIEFQGHDLASPLKNLPHIAGVINNPGRDYLEDYSTVSRCFKSINCELNRRMEIFARAKFSHEVFEPYLIVIIEDFDRLIYMFPEICDEIIMRILRLGKNIGVSLIASTQDIGSGIREKKILANFNFLACLGSLQIKYLQQGKYSIKF